tara:strand:- start:78 stop:905 length:828 start_codon:yes stop_codon:yes gene_type:complete
VKASNLTYIVTVPISAIIGLITEFASNESGWIVSLLSALFLLSLGLATALRETTEMISLEVNENTKRHKSNKIYSLFTKIAASNNLIFTKYSSELIEKTTLVLESASNGRLVLDRESINTLPMQLASNVSSELFAISIWIGGEEALGKGVDTYTQKLYDAANRSENPILVKRLFIVKKSDIKDEVLHKRMNRDMQKGKVEVRVMKVDQWISGTEELQNPVDFGIWDNELVWTYRTSHLSEELGDQAILLMGETNVQRFRKQFLLNFEHASRISEI